MNYDIFDEQYYLASYPWLKPAIDAGIIKSGREHFEKFGQAAGITKISRYFTACPLSVKMEFLKRVALTRSLLLKAAEISS